MRPVFAVSGKLALPLKEERDERRRLLVLHGKAMPKTAQRKTQPSRGFHKSERVLIVDDEKNIRLTLTQATNSLGVVVDTAASGSEALAKLEKCSFGLMLLDLKMPGRSSMEVLDGALLLQPELRVIVFSAHGTPEVAADAIKRGAIDFVEKPFTLEEFRDMLRQAFGGEHRETALPTLPEGAASRDTKKDVSYRVVVPVADPASEEIVLRLAAASAHSYEHSELVAVSVLELPRQTPLGYYKRHEDERSQLQKLLLERTQQDAQAYGVKLRARAIVGRRVHRVILGVLDEAADHLLLAWTGAPPEPKDRASPLNVFDDSTVGAIARKADCAVTLVKAGLSRKIRKVVALVSDGQHASRAARRAFEFARNAGIAQLKLMNVQSPGTSGKERSSQTIGEGLVRAAADKADIPENKYEAKVVISDDVEHAVREAATGYDLVCVGPPTHESIMNTPFGDTPEKIEKCLGNNVTVVIARGPGGARQSFIDVLTNRLTR